ncbi:hypothetical protein F2P44_02640 [Massilia sp. CCM 8695]|uniref:DUF4785 family protein n=1 Tax=Massilia frigida TaxID=2609281 RepID=A0ABX0MYX1_9BURK|nr:hypothetical protein [Massilia frigida]NHZ78189.1 hypothetical protein [Massilia frigida]
MFAAMILAAAVAQVYPTGAEVPENLLRISVAFDSASRTALLSRFGLRRASGVPIGNPFLEQELWSPDSKALTILLHPGRVKSGLAENPVLHAGDAVELTFDSHAIKRWTVRPADISGPMIGNWRIARVAAGSRQSVKVDLDAPIDFQGRHLIAVADASGVKVPGRIEVAPGERRWLFNPLAPWRKGTYRLVVHGLLEDPSGNRVSDSFELPSAAQRTRVQDHVVDFVIR